MADPAKTHVTPSGMRLAHFEKPYWAYTIDGEFEHPWTLDEPWGRVPSVTGIIGVLDKSRPLMGWASNVTYEACSYLTRTFGAPPSQHAADNDGGVLKRTAKDYKIDHTSVTSEAQLRGSSIHEIGENWVKHGAFPVLSEYPEQWRGYVRGIAKFLASWKGTFQMAEQITGSAIHGYAGTCDTVAIVTGTDGRRERLDYKTSRQVYARSHFRQLEGYELAAVEGGEEPTDRRGVVCLYDNGDYEVGYVPDEHACPTAFLNTLAVWRDEQPLKKLENKAYRSRLALEMKA